MLTFVHVHRKIRIEIRWVGPLALEYPVPLPFSLRTPLPDEQGLDPAQKAPLKLRDYLSCLVVDWRKMQHQVEELVLAEVQEPTSSAHADLSWDRNTAVVEETQREVYVGKLDSHTDRLVSTRSNAWK